MKVVEQTFSFVCFYAVMFKEEKKISRDGENEKKVIDSTLKKHKHILRICENKIIEQTSLLNNCVQLYDYH